MSYSCLLTDDQYSKNEQEIGNITDIFYIKYVSVDVFFKSFCGGEGEGASVYHTGCDTPLSGGHGFESHQNIFKMYCNHN